MSCDREFSTPTGAGVHILRAHKIGKDDPYPLSPSPVRSYVDPSTSMAPSLQSRRSRRISLVNSPLSGITTSSLQCSTYSSDDHDTFESRYVKPASPRPTKRTSKCPDVLSPINSQLPPPPSSFRGQSDDPAQVLVDLDPGYDDDIPPPSPPRPYPSSSIVSGTVSESLVAFAGCTDLNVEAPTFIPPTLPPSGAMTPLAAISPPDTINLGDSCPSPVMSPSPIPSSGCQPPPATTVAFSGCTDVRNPISPLLSSPSPTPDNTGFIASYQTPSSSSFPTSTPNRTTEMLVEQKIPHIWKHATTILIYKKGDSNVPSNFRPIALMSCIYKLFTSLFAMRVTTFAMTNDLMSAEQKCARPAEGCHEHAFTLQSIVADCKRNQKNCFIAWLDLKNAFGSISHEVIYTTLTHMGFPSSLIDLIKDIYTNASTTVKTSISDETDPIPIHAGVKQGCPISPILFNLSSELLIRSVKSMCIANSTIPFQLHGQPISVLAYADDLVLVSRTRQGLQELLNVVSKAAYVLSLLFRPEKCASISLTCSKREISNVTKYVFQGQDVPCLAKEESYRYLGIPIGLIYDADDMNSITERLIKDLEKLRDSLLTPWQKLDAIRTFIQPGLTYALRACPVTRESLSTYCSKLIQVLRSVCRLPNRSSLSYFFAGKSVGGLGLQDPFDERHVQKIVHTVKILSSTDPLIHEIAHGQLKSVVYRCIHRNPSDDEIDNFLSGSNEGGLNNHASANNSQTLWSCC